MIFLQATSCLYKRRIKIKPLFTDNTAAANHFVVPGDCFLNQTFGYFHPKLLLV